MGLDRTGRRRRKGSRRGPSFWYLQIGTGPRRSPSACSETSREKKIGRLQRAAAAAPCAAAGLEEQPARQRRLRRRRGRGARGAAARDVRPLRHVGRRLARRRRAQARAALRDGRGRERRRLRAHRALDGCGRRRDDRLPRVPHGPHRAVTDAAPEREQTRTPGTTCRRLGIL